MNLPQLLLEATKVLQLLKLTQLLLCKRTNHRTCDHADFMSFMDINQYHTGQGESSSRSRPSRLAIPFPSCIHCGYNDYQSNDCVYYFICEICGRKRESLQAKKVESFKASKTESSSALKSKTPTKRISTSDDAEDVAAVECCANILWIKSHLTDYDIIYEKRVDIFIKPLDKPSFKRLIDELGMLNIDSKPEASVLTKEN
ncbi:hypothetical protein Tco_0403434 [Tanacetum coccineum]